MWEGQVLLLCRSVCYATMSARAIDVFFLNAHLEALHLNLGFLGLCLILLEVLKQWKQLNLQWGYPAYKEK